MLSVNVRPLFVVRTRGYMLSMTTGAIQSIFRGIHFRGCDRVRWLPCRNRPG
jgi:hypothetical protein